VMGALVTQRRRDARHRVIAARVGASAIVRGAWVRELAPNRRRARPRVHGACSLVGGRKRPGPRVASHGLPGALGGLPGRSGEVEARQHGDAGRAGDRELLERYIGGVEDDDLVRLVTADI
jgi:hypothetical protein